MVKYFQILAALFFTVIFAVSVLAAPMPMTGSSKGVEPLWGLFKSSHGFVIDGRIPGWEISEGPTDNQNILAIFKGPTYEKNKSTLLTVRVDEDIKAKKPQNYVTSWLLLYNRLGLEVLGHKPFMQRGDRAFVIDLVNKSQNLQTRQALFFQGQKVVILTCNDSPDHFKKSLAECNQIIRSFQWAADSSNQISIKK